MKPKEALRAYEKANNSHNWSNVEPFIHSDAVFWFTDGEHKGKREIEKAVTKTFEKIGEEVYSIQNVKWLVVTDTTGVCAYTFHWEGIVDGKQTSGSGKGTNVFIKDSGTWKIIHEHLSK
jgi:ketosteroid isomerase-like protein